MFIRKDDSVMPEDTAQAMPVITDIRSPYHASRSFLLPDADNSLKTPGAQDRVALRRQYAPR